MVASIRPLPSDGPGPRSKVIRAADRHGVRDDLAGLLAHDLKTPLAAISMNLDYVLAELEGSSQEALVAAIDDCRLANARAVRIVSDMADAVQLASGDRSAAVSDVDLGRVVVEAVNRASQEAEARRVTVACAVERRVAQADATLLGRALDRVVERAMRHARAGGTIDVSLHKDGITVRVDSTVPGGVEPATSTLATYFADVALRAQGGELRTEKEESGALVYSLVLPR